MAILQNRFCKMATTFIFITHQTHMRMKVRSNISDLILPPMAFGATISSAYAQSSP
jgi:hypothetical protein